MAYSNPRTVLGYLLVVALTACLQLSKTTCADERNQEFPLLWSSVLSDLEKSYHVLYQLETAQSEEILTLEEWADYERHLFRLDLIAGLTRTSYLMNGNTGEVFRYKPYVCQLLAENATDLDVFAKLFIGYPWNPESSSPYRVANNNSGNTGGAQFAPMVAYGLGPLWLRAKADAVSIKLWPSGADEREHEFADEFDEFEVSLRPKLIADQVATKLRFFFPRGSQHFVDSIDWIVEPTGGDFHSADEHSVEARLKVLQVDYQAPSSAVFKLPVGYGCARRREPDGESQPDVGLELLHQGSPNQATLEVLFSQPHDDLLHSWSSQRYSMRWLRYSRQRVDDVAKTESFYSTQTHTRSARDGGKLKRIRHVWWAPDSSRGLATLYEIDESRGSCQVTHCDVRDQLMLGYLDSEQLAPGNPNIKPMVLSADQVALLFADSADYHLVDGGRPLVALDDTADAQAYRDRYYEKRVDGFKLTTDGVVTWDGPVSIVKRISSNSLSSRNLSEVGAAAGGAARLTLFKDYQVQVTLLFYGRKMDRLMYKIVMELLGSHEVSLAYAHEQLDVSACVADRERDLEQVSIKYPLERVELAKQLETKTDTIKSALFGSLFEGPDDRERFISPLQLSNVRLALDPFSLQLQLDVLELPLTHLFELTLDLALEPRDSSSAAAKDALLQTSASDADHCAAHCEHYNCRRFAYAWETRACTVDLAGDDELVRQVARDGSHLYTYFERRKRAPSRQATSGALDTRPHLSAPMIVEHLEELVSTASRSATTADRGGTSAVENPLVLRLKLRPDLSLTPDDQEEAARRRRVNSVTLVPSLLRRQLDSMNEFVREASALEDAPANATQVDELRLLKGRMQPQFVELFENRVFVPLQVRPNESEFERTTYEQCEQLCNVHNCRSFVYCARDETCQLSQAHDDKVLGRLSHAVPTNQQCNLYTLDYLSKFEPYGRVVQPLESRATIVSASPRVCANVCMDIRAFACQGFYFCEKPAKANSAATTAYVCHLLDRHVRSFSQAERQQNFDFVNSLAGDARPDPLQLGHCSLYSRSYLAQFDKFRGRKLVLPAKRQIGDVLTIQSSDSVDECARRCAEIGCLAFDSCAGVRGRSNGALGAIQCQLFVKGVRRNQVESDSRCSTFVLSDRSQFNAAKSKAIISQQKPRPEGAGNQTQESEPDQRADIGGTDGAHSRVVLNEELAEQEKYDPVEQELELLDAQFRPWKPVDLAQQYVRSSHWLARMFSLVVGVSLGAALIGIWNEAYARNWIERAKNWRPFES